MSIKAMLSLIGFVEITVAIISWLICLVRYDGADICDETECDICPFPLCDKKEGTK